jgi:hypothetical protein
VRRYFLFSKFDIYINLVWSSTHFDWIARIRATIENSNGEAISFDKLKREVNWYLIDFYYYRL